MQKRAPWRDAEKVSPLLRSRLSVNPRNLFPIFPIFSFIFLETSVEIPRVSTIFTTFNRLTNKWVRISWKFISCVSRNQPILSHYQSFKANTGIYLSRYVTSWFSRNIAGENNSSPYFAYVVWKIHSKQDYLTSQPPAPNISTGTVARVNLAQSCFCRSSMYFRLPSLPT